MRNPGVPSALLSAPCLRLRPRVRLTQRRPLVTLAIETSCDDTAVAVLEHNTTTSTTTTTTTGETPRNDLPRTRLLFNERISADLRAYRGIRPAAALEGHQRTLAGLVQRAIAHLPHSPVPGDGGGGGGGGGGPRPDFVSATRGPGIHGNLSTGLFTAKGLALAWGVPLVGVHHMQAHALTPRLVRALGMPMASEDDPLTRSSGGDAAPGSAGNTPEFPFLTLLVSGGHSQLVLSAGLTDHRVLATTADAAVGNVLDQVARVILPEEVLAASPDVMYGRLLESYAFDDDDHHHHHHPSSSSSSSLSSSSSSSSSLPSSPYAFYDPPRGRADELADVDTGYPWRVPLPMRATRRLAYSFSAVHSAVHARAAFQHLASRLCLALDPRADYEGAALARRARTLVVAGGVACNKFLMHVLRTTLEARGLLSSSSSAGDSHAGGGAPAGGIREIIAPPVALCTDNAAMIAWAGMEMYAAGWHSDLDVAPVAKWPLDAAVRLPGQKEADGGGLMEIGGWLRRS
ncbi:O-sialoglycoprotein endopeptidase [Cordyceps javanica]|uniref:O-sialoglycoprotein endopeptidase n=1 Tax=Cordyceps javanica TaxID=43265 RepID=A0A545VD64_9HYPO|nr:O-sialoglycoprotein endopeptidase [Cordyceps javanica]